MLDTTFIIAGCSKDNFGFGFFFVSFSKLVESLNVILKGLNFQTDENSLGFFLSSYEFCTEHSAKLTTKERKAKEEELYKQR